MTAIGSVFLGDVQRQRILSTSTPPSSPPPHLLSSFTHFADPDLDEVQEQPPPAANAPPTSKPPPIPPALSLELRLRWLETLLYGASQDANDSKADTVRVRELKAGGTLARHAEDLQRKLDSVVQTNDGLRKFMDHYDQHAQYLTLAFALSGTIPTDPPTYENMTPSEMEAFLAELEPDIRAADRDMQEIMALESKGITGAGKLTEYETLRPRLDALLNAHEEDLKKASELEQRIAGLMDRYATRVDTLSELFIDWDTSLRGAEDRVAKLERDKEERRKLGYES